jgi:mercuric ion transport protein
MTAPHAQPPGDPDRPGRGATALSLGAAVLVIVCCAGPALLAAGVLGAVGGFLANPWVIAAAVGLAILAVTLVARRRSHGEDCCAPTDPDSQERSTDHSATKGQR